MSHRERLVVVGNGMVGQRFVEDVLTTAPDRFAITIIGGEPVPAYNRVLLSSLLAGEIETADTAIKSPEWYKAQAVTLNLGSPAIRLDTAAKQVKCECGESLPYDHCVLATGSDPIRLPLPGAALDGVCTFRQANDVEAFQRFAKTGAPAVVIGGGLLGIETAYGLARAGVNVTLVHLMDRLMERQVDQQGATLIRLALEERGVRVVLKAETKALLGNAEGLVSAVALTDGRTIQCGLVVMAVGIQANAALASASDIAVGRGIQVDDRLQTSSKDVFAIGECAEHRGRCYGLVEPGYEQARILAQRFAGREERYTGSVTCTNLKVSGVPVFSAGVFDHDADMIATHDTGLPAYRKLCLEEGRLVGVVLVGDTTDSLWYRDLIKAGTSVDSIRESLAFGKAYAEAA